MCVYMRTGVVYASLSVCVSTYMNVCMCVFVRNVLCMFMLVVFLFVYVCGLEVCH